MDHKANSGSAMTLARGVHAAVLLSTVFMIVLAARPGAGEHVQIIRHDADRRVDVLVDGRPFTSYIWPVTIKKPVLYPIRSAHGTLVTRGFPLDPRPGERVDHPHHVGLWFNYGDVDGIDFWNNSDAIPAADRGKMGTIVHRSIVSASSGADAGELVTLSDWVMPDGRAALHQNTTYVFRGDTTTRSIDVLITLTAGDRRVTFPDTKEGTLGLRVARALEEPTTTPEVFTDASGRPTTVASMDNTGVNGVYLTSEGTKGSAVWGTRGKWCLLSGVVGDEPVAIAIFDHPSNPGYPTYWHARGYGLFAANPLGQKALSNGKDTLNFAIDPNKSAAFRYRVLIVSGKLSSADVERAWTAWARKHD
jgi:Methane oxygenase PmoA